MSARHFDRREFLHAGVAAGVALPAAAATAPRLAEGKRNAILIITDTMRRDALSCFGGQWVHTPHLEAFARSGVRFPNAYPCSFPTVPTRHDILTGRYTFTYKPWSPLDRDTITLQDVLRPHGVYTAVVADTPHPFKPDYNYQRNFDFVQIHRGQEADAYRTAPIPVHLPCDPKKLRDGERVVTQYLRNVADRKVEEDYFCARTMRGAADWLQKNHRRQPFFLYVDTFDPHEPWDPPASYVKSYDPDYHGQEVIYPRYDRWRDFLTERELKHCRALYAGEASLVDRWVGHLLQTIERLGLLENTLVIHVADHGFYLGEHGYIGKSLVRGKQYQNLSLYSEICRIPLLMHFPGCKAGSACDALAQTVNLGPTILDFFGIRKPPTFSAPSLWPVLKGQRDAVNDIVVCSPPLSTPQIKKPHPTDRASISDGRWLLIYGSTAPGEAGDTTLSVDSQKRWVSQLTGEPLVPELYDLQQDPGCLHNIIATQKDRARDLHRKFVALLEKSPMRRDHLQFFQKL
jgi:arylsulfatase A-like enzyme